MRLLRTFVFCSFLLGACSSLSSPTQLSPTVLPLVGTPISTSAPNTPTSVPTETATKNPGPVSEIPLCTNMNVQEVISADYEIPGVMLSLDRPSYSSSGHGDYQKSSLYRFDLPTRARTFFIESRDYQEEIRTKITRLGVQDLNASPDFQKVVYLVDAYVDSTSEARKSWLEIYDSSTNKRQRLLWKDEWDYIVGWLNNDRFAIRSGGSILLFDSEAHMRDQFLSSKLPDYANPRTYDPDVFVLWGGYRKIGTYSFNSLGLFMSFGSHLESVFSPQDMTKLYNPTLEIYSPTLESVIYTEIKDGKPGVVLYNIQAKQKVIEIATGDYINPKSFGAVPVWSPDGSRAVMLLPASKNNYKEQNLFLLDKDGKVEKLTSFEVRGPYSWSPDGSYLAFWLADGKQIGILNIENKELRVFCINGDYSNEDYLNGNQDSSGLPTSGDLVWLPNNNQILVEIVKKSNHARYDGIGVADLETAVFTELQWNVRFPVWLIR